MIKEDIIRMAQEADIKFKTDVFRSDFCDGVYEVDLERFAALVASAEREKVAAWMMQCGYATGHGDTVEDLLKELDWQAKEREREACAKLCDDDQSEAGEWTAGAHVGGYFAVRIRARGQA